MSHQIYTGIVEVQNLGPEFDASTNPIVLKLDSTISKLPSGALKANVSGAIAAGTTNLTLNGGPALDLLPAIKAGETLTTITYDPVLKKITYTGENGTPIIVDLSALATDVFITGSSYDPATMVLTLTDNSATTPDIVLNLSELKKVATSNSPSVSFAGTGEASSPLIATVTSIPAGVTIPASQVTDQTVVNTVADTPTGSMLVTTVNGVASVGINIPDNQVLTLAGTVAAPTLTISNGNTVTFPGSNTFAITKTGGAVSTVNTIAATQAIPVGTVVDVIGFNAAGASVSQAINSLSGADFWRSNGTALPDGVTDTTDSISHDGRVKVGAGTAPNSATMTVVNSGTSAIVPFSNTGLIVSDTATARIFLEAQGSAAGNKVMLLHNSAGATAFGVTTDNGATFTRDNILRMDHATGDLGFNAYPNTRNDAGVPVNILSTDASGFMRSHPVSEISAMFVKNTTTATSAYTVPAQTVVGATITYVNLVLIPQAGTINLPAVATYPKNTELYLKTTGIWTGSVGVSGTGGAQVDGATSFTYNKTAAGLRSSITVMHDGVNWFVV